MRTVKLKERPALTGSAEYSCSWRSDERSIVDGRKFVRGEEKLRTLTTRSII